jgi:hypothetical protein
MKSAKELVTQASSRVKTVSAQEARVMLNDARMHALALTSIATPTKIPLLFHTPLWSVKCVRCSSFAQSVS